VQPCDEDDVCFCFSTLMVEWHWQDKNEVLEEKPVPMPLSPSQIRHGTTRDRTRASAVRGRRLTAWAMSRPSVRCYSHLSLYMQSNSFLTQQQLSCIVRALYQIKSTLAH
jgi:hypothetical protein